MANDLQAGSDTGQRALKATARVAGLRDFVTPTLEQVERRRYELMAVTFLVLIGLTLAGAVLSLSTGFLGGGNALGISGVVARILPVLLTVTFGLYVLEKERNLTHLSRILVNERVLSAALSNRLKEISSLTEAGKAVVSMLDLPDVLRVVLAAASDLLEADEGSVLLVDGGYLVVAAAVGHAERFIGTRRPLTDGLAGEVAKSREPLLIEGRLSLAEHSTSVRIAAIEIESAICVPLESEGELLGVLNINVTIGSRRYNEYDLRALKLFGEHAALAIRHAQALARERELRTQITELDRVRSQLIGSMAHDLKTPLTTILGNAKLLRRTGVVQDGEPESELVDTIENQSARLLSLIERLLDAAHSVARPELKMQSLDLSGVVRRLTAAYAAAHGREVRYANPDASAVAWVDPEAVDQIVANLIENAVKHTPDSSVVTVSTASATHHVDLIVHDDGPGVPPDQIESVFLPFNQGSATEPGIGLGLFIVSNLVEAMGGRVTVTNSNGARFMVSLPKDAPAGTVLS